VTGTLAPYSAYRDSGAGWLGEVPEHWEVRSLGTFGRFSKGSGGTKADETERGVPCVRYGDLYTRHRFHITESKACVAPHRAGAYTPVRYGDVLFAGSGETLEEIGKSAVNLIRGSAVCGGDVIVFRPTIDIDAEFIGWSTDCRQAASQKARMGRGITVMHIYSSDLKYLAVPLPPLPEQTAIARFLDDADRRIRRYIRAKERLIDLLEEERRATIHEAVTGRIDVRTGQPYPAYKASGVEWLGQVPGHWEIRRVATVAHLRVSNVDKHVREGESPVRLCNYMDVYHNERIGPDLPFMVGTATEREIRRFRLAEADVLITKDSEDWSDIGVPALVECAADDLVCGYHLAMLRPDEASLDGGYLFQALGDAHVAWQFQGGAAGVTRYGLSQNAIRSIRIPLPPLTEQTAIARFLAATGRRISARRAAVKREIELHREYRTRLIADVVTGKFDVREMAAKLPETDPLAPDRDRGDTIPTESNPRLTERDVAKEAMP